MLIWHEKYWATSKVCCNIPLASKTNSNNESSSFPYHSLENFQGMVVTQRQVTSPQEKETSLTLAVPLPCQRLSSPHCGLFLSNLPLMISIPWILMSSWPHILRNFALMELFRFKHITFSSFWIWCSHNHKRIQEANFSF